MMGRGWSVQQMSRPIASPFFLHRIAAEFAFTSYRTIMRELARKDGPRRRRRR